MTVFALGGFVAEFVGYLFRLLPAYLPEIEFALEEGLEMLGTIIVLCACLNHLNRQLQLIIRSRNYVWMPRPELPAMDVAQILQESKN